MIENIAFVYKNGGDFTLEYVKRLVDAVNVHCTIPVNIYCLSNDSDVSEFCNHIPLKHDEWFKWWAKLELFENFENCLYFDLDTIIRGDIAPLLKYDHHFTMLEDFYYPEFTASGVMAWKGDFRYLAERYNPELETKYLRTGDQGWINDNLQVVPERFQKLFPGVLGSYKAGYNGCGVVCFHGIPRPHSVRWVI